MPVQQQKILHGDAFDLLKALDNESVDMCFTSPSPGQPHLEDLFAEVYRVLKPTGSLWVQMGDYHRTKDLSLPLTPMRFAINMVDNYEWYCKNPLCWHRINRDDYQEDYNRFRRDWEYVFFFTKQSRDYYFNNPGNRSLSSVLRYPYVSPRKGELGSGFPEGIIETAILRGCPPGGIVLDPLAGTGTTGLVAKRMGRGYIMIDNNEKAVRKMTKRLIG